MTEIRNIIFDFDGTLADTTPLIVATMQASMRELHLPYKSHDECVATIGLRLEDVPESLWPECGDMGEMYAATYRRLFDEIKTHIDVQCYPYVISTLRRLHDCGYKLAVASSRNHASLVDYADKFGIADVFDMLVGGDDVKHGKPAPDPVMMICRSLNWNVADTLVVGDAVFDIEMGHNAGAYTCAVTYGNQTAEQLAVSNPDMMIGRFAALLPMLKGENRGIG